MNIPRIGFGYDVHCFSSERKLWLGGIQIEHEMGLLGHSDADVLIHAICDALLGAANLRDIGFHFPDNEEEYCLVDSKILLKRVVAMIVEKGYQVGNIDCTVCAEQPKINSYIPQMQECLSGVMKITKSQISIKATTNEKMGFIGRKEGIAVYAVALIAK